MDPRIEALKSTTFFGRRFTRRQIADIAETVAMLPNDSRNELSKTICEHLGWKALVDRYHYLGCPRPFGPHIRWFVRDRSGRPLAVLLFEAAARELPARDEWIGWSEADRGRRLHLAVSNSRFLVLPWVRVDNLASKALALALRGLAERWEANHGCRPVLCETFIDPTRFDGACHKAANWETIGMTAGKRSGRGAKPAKEILVRPLDPEFRAVLKGETTPGPRPKRRSPAAFDHGFAAMWSRIADAAADIAARHDETWMKAAADA